MPAMTSATVGHSAGALEDAGVEFIEENGGGPGLAKAAPIEINQPSAPQV